MEHRFTGPAYTLGIEEELMILDAETLDLSNAIETILEALPPVEGEPQVKEELMESVVEIMTTPAGSIDEVSEQLRGLRRTVKATAGECGLAIGSAGTHPFALWEEQRIVARPRYQQLVSALRWVARQELIFGVHVHVGIDDPEKAIHVANGMRVHLPLLLALSANSPFWRADQTGLVSTRTPVFRTFPRVGIPPRYDDWEDYTRRVTFMVDSRVVEDYTYLWYDVRPHPRLGTVEVRVMDAQTRVEHTLGLSALVQALVKERCEHFDAGRELSSYPYEMLDENKFIAARYGLEGELVDLPREERVATQALARRVIDRVREHAEDLGSDGQLMAVDELLEHGNGALRQTVVYEANHDRREVVRDVVERTSA
jgi:glutamate---cysteine ligase / carboxylate-amine ligase